MEPLFSPDGSADAPCGCRGQRAESPGSWGRAALTEARAPRPEVGLLEHSESTESPAAGT